MSGLLPLTGGQQRFFLLAGGREWNVGLGRAQLEVFPLASREGGHPKIKTRLSIVIVLRQCLNYDREIS